MSIRFEKVGKEFPKLDMLDELNREAFPAVSYTHLDVYKRQR